MANEYSKITSVEVHNFMPYKYAKAVFDEQGILNIKGYNSSGKSAFEIAIAVCLMDMYKSKQGKFIKHGEQYFRVVVNFDDGISIVRDKYDNGQSLYEMYEDGKCIFTTKQGNKLAKVSDVPTPIQQYLDLIGTDTGFLNYQQRKDPLWLVETKGAENYNDLNEVLKTEEISRANAMLNSDINSLNSEIAMIEAELQRKELRLEATKGITNELVEALVEKNAETSLISSREVAINDASSVIKEVTSIIIPEEINKIEGIGRVKDLEGIQDTVSRLGEVVVTPVVERVVNVDRLSQIGKLQSDIEEIQEMQISYPEMSKIEGLERQKALSSIYSTLKSLYDVVKNVKELELSEDALIKEKEQFVSQAKKDGTIYVECKNCGTLMEVNTSGI